jgi:hypothetical protein
MVLRPPLPANTGKRKYISARRIQKCSRDFVSSASIIGSDRLPRLWIGNSNTERLLGTNEILIKDSYLLSESGREQFYLNATPLQLPKSLTANSLIRVQYSDENPFRLRATNQFGTAGQRIRTNVRSAWFEGCVERRTRQQRSIGDSTKCSQFCMVIVVRLSRASMILRNSDPVYRDDCAYFWHTVCNWPALLGQVDRFNHWLLVGVVHARHHTATAPANLFRIT